MDGVQPALGPAADSIRKHAAADYSRGFKIHTADEFHGINTPSHAKDLYEHYLVWFGRYLKGEKTAKVH